MKIAYEKNIKFYFNKFKSTGVKYHAGKKQKPAAGKEPKYP